jgi:hypothetical protein
LGIAKNIEKSFGRADEPHVGVSDQIFYQRTPGQLGSGHPFCAALHQHQPPGHDSNWLLEIKARFKGMTD